MSKKSQMSAGAVLNVLRDKHFHGSAYAMLREVRNRTGFGSGERYADALVISCWPSRGLWLAGVEVKVNRYDWLRELKDPSKSASIQKFCHYWWVAATPGVVEAGELPETWGLIEVDGKKRSVVKEAPRLQPEAPTMEFIASVFRKLGESNEGSLRAEYERGKREALDGQEDPDVEHLNNILSSERRSNELLRKQLGELNGKIRDFELKTGLNVLHDWMDQASQFVKAAQALSRVDTTLIEQSFLHVVAALQQARAAVASTSSNASEAAQ